MKYKLFKILAFFVLLVPFGLLSNSPAWGEWENEYYIKALGYLPKGMVDAHKISPILQNYSFGNTHVVLWYFFSAIIGISLIFLVLFLLYKVGKNSVTKS